jgi:2,6-dihydroxypyridine 3-monooxygenase
VVRAVVAGGSLGGLAAGLALRDAGCDVRVFERSQTALQSRGAGIVLHEETVRYFVEHRVLDVEAISTSVDVWRYLHPSGDVAHEQPTGHRFTAWNTLYRAFRASFDDDRYHLGEALVGFDQDPDGVTVRFAAGGERRCELLVGADGISSTTRRRLLPSVEPVYAGYVGWRGTVEEEQLSKAAFAALSDAITYCVLGDSHILIYPIPSVEGAVSVGERYMNFVWYRNVPAGPPADELLTDRDGGARPLSVPPGAVQERYVRQLKQDAETLLPGPVAEVVVSTPEPFLQAIVDLEVPGMAFGRVCLIGDGAFAARPHAAAGTAKAAADAWALGRAVADADREVPKALAAWEPGQLGLGRQLVARVKDMGHRSQVAGTWHPGDPSLAFGLRGPGR